MREKWVRLREYSSYVRTSGVPYEEEFQTPKLAPNKEILRLLKEEILNQKLGWSHNARWPRVVGKPHRS